MGHDKFWPRTTEELVTDPVPVSLLNEPVREDVGVLVPKRRRSLHSVIAQTLADVESLIARLELGVDVAASARPLVRELYLSCRQQRELLATALRLEGLE